VQIIARKTHLQITYYVLLRNCSLAHLLTYYRKTSNKRPRRLLEHGPHNPGI